MKVPYWVTIYVMSAIVPVVLYLSGAIGPRLFYILLPFWLPWAIMFMVILVIWIRIQMVKMWKSITEKKDDGQKPD